MTGFQKGKGALEYAERTLRGASKGTRHNTLFSMAAFLGRVVNEGDLSLSEAESTLRTAAKSLDLEDHRIRANLRSGLSKGMKSPARHLDGLRAFTPEPRPRPPENPRPNPAVHFRGSKFKSLEETSKPERFDWTLEELAAHMLKTPSRVGDKEHLEMLALAYFDPSGAREEHLLEQHGMVLDVDKGNNTEEDLRGAFGGVCFAAHTTWSHRPNDQKWRVLIPYSRTVSKGEHKALWRWASNKLAGLDPVGERPTQRYFIPGVSPETESLYVHIENKGPALDVDAVLTEDYNPAAGGRGLRPGSARSEAADGAPRRAVNRDDLMSEEEAVRFT